MCGLAGQVVTGKLQCLEDRDTLVDTFQEQVVEGKIFASSCQADMLNGSQGALLLDVREKVVVVVGRGELPDKKQRWFTVACKWDQVPMEAEDHLVIKQSSPKLHGWMGLTHLRVEEDLLWSSGRDGFLRC